MLLNQSVAVDQYTSSSMALEINIQNAIEVHKLKYVS
jgi:hypothetical protein